MPKGKAKEGTGNHDPGNLEKRGPKPEAVKIDVDREEAVKKSLQKKKPKKGWPK